MAIGVEWILNKYKKKIYAVSHAKAVIRNNSTVDEYLTSLEKSVQNLEEVVKNFQNTSSNIGSNTVFNTDGSIVTTYVDGKTETTVFNTDGSIVTTYAQDDEVLATETTVFNTDGSVTITYK